MGIEFLKRAAKTPDTETASARKVVDEMLAEIEKRREAAVREYAQKLDQWSSEIIVTPDEIKRRTRSLPASLKRDIEFATAQVRAFALAQKESLRDFSTELRPGLVAGQRPSPGERAGWSARGGGVSAR